MDILVNNAVFQSYLPIEQATVNDFHQHFNVNVLGPVLTIQASLKLFGDKGGNIINISSGASKYPLPAASLYSATKATLDAITISLSKELGAKNVRINSILPGATETEGAASAGVTPGSEYEKMFVANRPLGRRGQPEDIAKAVVFQHYIATEHRPDYCRMLSIASDAHNHEETPNFAKSIENKALYGKYNLPF